MEFVPAVCKIVTAGVTELFNVKVMAELTAVGVLAQDELPVRIQVISSPLDKDEEVKEELFVPALLPFTSHW
jgi:hypothetical protein